MGLFSGSTEVYVSSTVYNLAGEEIDRPQYLKTLVIRSALSGSKDGIGQSIVSSALNGPGIQFRSFFRWAQDNYGLIGLPRGNVESGGSVSTTAIGNYIPKPADKSIWVQKVWIDSADYGLWVEQWFLENAPDLADTAWTADIRNSDNLITIVFADGSTTSFYPAGFDPAGKYVFAYYTLVDGETPGELVTGVEITVPTGEAFPETTDWTLLTDSTTPLPYPTVRMRSYTRDLPLTNTDPDVDQILVDRQTMWFYETNDGVEVTKKYRVDSQTVALTTFGKIQLYTYKIGSGIVDLDGLLTQTIPYGNFYPIIPFRHDNNMLSTTYKPEAYALAKKAFKKGTGGSNLDDVIEKIAGHENIGDIDYGYVVYGVSLNVIENSCRKYIYNFFRKLMIEQVGGGAAYDNILASVAGYNTAMANWTLWRQQHSNGSSTAAPPALPVKPSLPVNEIKIDNSGPNQTNYDIRLQWIAIAEKTVNGVGKSGAKKGELWFQEMGDENLSSLLYTTSTIRTHDGTDQVVTVKTDDRYVGKIRLYWQFSDTQYRYLDVVGMVHRNYVYESKNVLITAREALADTEESGFIIPLHYGTYREMSLIDASQMTTACVFLVFNSYEIVKRKWWQSGFFKFLLAIVIAVVSVVFTGGAGLGLLGSHLAVGTALGFTGMTAAIIGSIANALAAIILSTLVEKLVGNLGIIGQILGVLVSFAIGSMVSSFQNTGIASIQWGDLIKADKILALTDAVANGVAKQIQGDTMSIYSDMQTIQAKTKQEVEKIQQAYFNEFGYGAGQIDPFMLVDSTSGPMAESSDTFLTRTLMTGSEIAEMSKDLLYGFTEYSLKLPDAFT